MIKLVASIAGLLFVNFALADNQMCSREMVGSQFCLANKTMTCVKVFNPELREFKFEMRGVNVIGHAFNTSIPWYEKTMGYSPIPCSDVKLGRAQTIPKSANKSHASNSSIALGLKRIKV